MNHRRQQIELVEDEELLYDKDSPWAVFEPDDHANFFPDSSRTLLPKRVERQPSEQHEAVNFCMI